MKTFFTPNFKRQVLFGGLIALMFSSTQVGAQNNSTRVKDARYERGGSFAGFQPSDEVADRRTRNAKHFKNSNGSFTVVTGGTYHYKDAANRWQDISLSLVPANKTGYSFANESNEFKTYLPQNPGTYPVQMVLSNGIAFNWWQQPAMSFSNGTTVVNAQKKTPVKQSEKTINYANVYEGITEQFEMLPNGIENNTIVHALSQQVKGLPKGTIIEFSQFIPMPSGWTVDVAGIKKQNTFSAKDFHINIPGTDGIYFGQIVAFDQAINKNKALFLVNAPLAKLSELEKKQKEQNVLVCNYDVQFVAGGLKVTTKVPADWLKAGNRSFPVTIDPTVTITPTSGMGADYYTPTSNWYGFQRHANLYLASEIGVSNISISAIEYNRGTTDGNNAVSPNKVFFRTTTANTLTAAAWNSATYTGGLTPAFNASVDFHGTTTGWKMFTLTTPFTYNSDNLVVMVYDAYGGSGNAKYMNRSSTIQNRQAYMRQDGSDPGDATNLSTENYLPEIRLTYTMTTACSGTPNAGTVAASVPDSVCPNIAFTLAADGITYGSGMAYQWQQSAAATGPWTDIAGATNPSYTIAAGITTATYYRLRSICNSGTPVYTNAKQVTIKSFINCYCTPTYTYGCSNGATLNSFATTGAMVNVTNNNTGCASGGVGYSNYMSMQITAALGMTFNVAVEVTQYSGGVKIWADWNHDGIFDPVTELCAESPNTISSGSSYNGTVTVPATALGGVTKFRVRVVEGSTTFNPCGNEYYGETEDYSLLVSATGCTGTPNAGTVAPSVPDSVCPNTAFTLAANGITFGSGMAYQWQQSAAAAGPWTDIAGATNPNSTIAAGITTATYYRLRSICNSGTPVYTNVKYITIKSFITCHCTPTYTYGCSNGATLNSFATTGAVVNVTNNNTGCASGAVGYSNYMSMQITAIQGTTFNVAVNVTQYSGGVRIWADWNHDGVFDPVTELCAASPNTITAGGTYNGTVTVPATALLGVTKFRVRVVEGATSFSPCSNEYYGETEDYSIQVNTMPLCTAVTPPTNLVATATPSSLCVTGSTNLTLNTTIQPAVGQTFQWQSSPTGATWTDIAGATNPTLAVATLTTTTHYRLQVKCNSNVVATSVPDTVNVNTPVQPVGTGASRCGPGTLQLTATPAIPTNTVRWYENVTGGVPLATGNTFTTPNINTTTTYYVTEAASGSVAAATLSTTDAGGNGCTGGVMFDIDPNISLTIDSFKAKAYSGGSNVTVKVYTRNGTFVGNETNPSAWTLHTTAVIPTTTAGVQFNIPIPTTITIAPNVLTGIYIEYDAAYTNMPTPTLYSNADLDIITGTGLCSSFGGTNLGRAFNGSVHYRASSICEAARVPVVATVNPVPAVNIGADFDTCIAVAATFNLEAGPQPNNATYLWDNGTTSSSRAIGQTGVYHVAVTNSFGCVGYDTISATIRSKPIVDLGTTTTICGGGMQVLDAGPGGQNGGSYYWSTGETTRTIEATAAGTYIVYVTSPDACLTIDTVELIVNGQMPELDGILVTAQTASTFIFTADNPVNIVQYIWDYGDGSPRDTTTVPTTQHQYTANGNYWLKLFSNSTCGEVVDSIMVTIIGGVGVNNVDNEAQIKLYPNPTYDNVVFLEAASGIEISNLKVFNVVGQEVLSRDISDKRSNKHRIVFNKDLAAGVYHIKIQTNKGMVNKKLEILK
ncbi:MAG: T9SS type A sorting domain-containing protein [Taibaiella sp.]|nr:T9SS type A sorting domain-containing protein [Taibaiella sp.]